MIANLLKKTCTKCKRHLSRDCFSQSFNGRSGKFRTHAYCKKCRVIDNKIRGLSPVQKLKTNARSKLNYAIKVGKIKRLPCAVCGANEKIHAHHKDYARPLEVIFLCHVHHYEAHSRERIENGLMVRYYTGAGRPA